MYFVIYILYSNKKSFVGLELELELEIELELELELELG